MPFTTAELFGAQQSDCHPRTIRILAKLIKNGRIPIFALPVLKDEIAQIQQVKSSE